MLSGLQRWLLGLASACILVGFSVAASVEPDPRGFGTHQQFGFPPCSFRVMFQVPCPSCGGTTSVAHFVRGQWLSAVRANPAVFCLAAVCALFVPWSWLSLRRGRLWGVASPLPTLLWILVSLSGLATAHWLFRLTGS